MKIKEIRELSQEELRNKVSELKEALFKLRFQAATKQLENPKAISNTKKDIARVMTILAQREFEQSVEEASS